MLQVYALNTFSCNLGKVAANAMMTSKHKLTQEIEAYIALFVYAQQHYGSKYSEEFTFKMFVSEYNHRDLIFQVELSWIISLSDSLESDTNAVDLSVYLNVVLFSSLVCYEIAICRARKQAITVKYCE